MSATRERVKLELARSRRPAAYLALLGVCALASATVIFSNQTLFQGPWEDSYELRLAFEDAKGVVPGQQEVRVAGVQVGLVSDSRLVDGRAIVTVSLEPEYAPVYRDARARLRPVTPLQDMYVALERGTPAAGALREGDVIEAGHTVSPVDISRVMNTFDADVRLRLSRLLDAFGSGLEDRGESLRAAFAQAVPFLHTAQRVSQALADRDRELRRVVSNLADLSGALARRDRQLADLVQGAGHTLGELAGRDRPLAATLAELPPTLSTARDAFAQLRAAERELDPALEALLPAARRLERGLGGLERFARDARPALRVLRPAVRDLGPFAAELAGTAPPLGRAFSALESAAPAVDRVTAAIPPCFEELEALLHNSASVWKFGDAYGAITRADMTFGLDSPAGATGGDLNLRRVESCSGARGGYR